MDSYSFLNIGHHPIFYKRFYWSNSIMYNTTYDEYTYIDIYIHNLGYKLIIFNNKL